MDLETLQFYSQNAEQLAVKFSAASGGISKYFSAAFSADGKVLDIGCGAGRDLYLLHEMGFKADGIDACQEFIDQISRDKLVNGTAITQDQLPGLNTVDDNTYHGILCSAVLMHLPEEQLFDAAFSIRRILKEHGRLLLSIPLADVTIDIKTKRDVDGRFFNQVTAEEIQLLFERIGFKLLNRWNDADSLDREHRKWATMLFELENSSGTRPIDTIESILNKDAKVATYKLALFRAFANIATTNYKLAQWTNDGRVKISTLTVAEKWLEYYWPIIEAGIKQTSGKPIAFRSQLVKLVQYYHKRGGLSAFCLAYRNNQLPTEALKLCNQLLSVLKRTIWNQPVRYAGGGDDFSVFNYDKKDQTIIIGNDIWKELSLMGTWIQDATILRWAELTARISSNELKPCAVIDCLLTVPIQNREVNAAKSFYDSLKDKICVWSGKNIAGKYDLDHAIPFSLWKNNDLWNLLPADSKVNGSKKNKLPEHKLIKARKDCIVYYWTLINRKFPARFEYEAGKLIGQQQLGKNNWENKLFASFAEAVEITAIQRGIERWVPVNLAATGTDGCSYKTVKNNIQIVRESDDLPCNSEKNRIVKIVSGGQTGADRGGLDAAIDLGVPHGGWCPKGRIAEDGTVPDKYRLKEATSKAYLRRTELNVEDSTATVILCDGKPGRGSKKTADFAEKHAKPYLLFDTNDNQEKIIESIVNWLEKLPYPKVVLNVAGSRGSKAPTLHDDVKAIIIAVITRVNNIDVSEQETDYETEPMIELPFYADLRIACGAFMNGKSEFTADTMKIANPHNNLDPEKHFIVRATSDSMDGGHNPIKDGDLLLFELNQGGTVTNQLFAIEYQDGLGSTSYVLKRIEKDATGKYMLISRNKKYPPIPVDPERMFPFARLKYKLSD